jgi:hypothetical protein
MSGLSGAADPRGVPVRRLFLLLWTAVVALTGVAAVAAPEATAAQGVGALRICTGCAAAGGDLSKYDFVVLNSWDHPRIPALKAANPNVKVLVYKDASLAVDYMQPGDEYLPGGVNYWSADPSWFLLDTTGARVRSSNFPNAWLMDVGSTSYQDAWLHNVLADVQGHGWDGVLLDDVNESMTFHLGGRTLARYPTNGAWYQAMRSFLARVGPGLTSQGVLAVPNINFDCWEACWRDYLQFVSGAMREWWSKNGTQATGHYTGASWEWANSFLRITQEAGKFLLPVMYAPLSDTRSMRFARASFLLDWDGGSSSFVFEPTDPEAQNPYSPEWTVDIGRPLAPRYRVGVAWRRQFTGGTALVNPSPTRTQTVKLGGSYLMPDGTRVTSVSLRPATGLILRSAPRRTQPAPRSETTLALRRAASLKALSSSSRWYRTRGR